VHETCHYSKVRGKKSPKPHVISSPCFCFLFLNCFVSSYLIFFSLPFADTVSSHFNQVYLAVYAKMNRVNIYFNYFML